MRVEISILFRVCLCLLLLLSVDPKLLQLWDNGPWDNGQLLSLGHFQSRPPELVPVLEHCGVGTGRFQEADAATAFFPRC